MWNKQEGIAPESPLRLLERLEKALSFAPDYERVYRVYNQIFTQCLEENTRFVRLTLCGPFAKTDYLLKVHGADDALSQAVNETRVRLRNRDLVGEEELRVQCRHDFKHLCLFLSIIYKVELPERLVALFPLERARKSRKLRLGAYLRVVVNRWDDDFIYADRSDDTGGEVKIAYSHVARGNVQTGNTDNWKRVPDWSYLRDMLTEGTQLNLVHPVLEQNIVTAELYIVEPDYLVDVSAIANCFQNYAESASVHLLRKLQSTACSQQILLGNFAGQLLDEAIQDTEEMPAYAESARRFFDSNALSLITSCEDSRTFHESARRQQENIFYAMRTQLPEAIEGYEATGGVVEPSFFSEMLGLQGRMDYMRMERGVIIEQKSGKGKFPFDGFITPKYRDDHYVQMLLYMLIYRNSCRKSYEANHRNVYPFLLYSGYQQSLIGLGYAPDLVFRAMKVRNGIAHMEVHGTVGNGFRVLESLTPDDLNELHVQDNLWKNYQSKQIAELLAPIHKASPLERAYYFRFLTFVANEHLLAKLGNKTKENSGFAAKWHDSLEEKRSAGNIYDRLTLLSPSDAGERNVASVVLQLPADEDTEMSNFRVGDIVILYPYDAEEEPDVRKGMVFRCSIERIANGEVHLQLRYTQGSASVFVRDAKRPWAIEHDFYESSVSALYRGMHAFLCAPQERKDLLLMQRFPKVDSTCFLKGEYGSFNELSLRVKQAKDLFLIIGPPGTGKTSFGMLNTVKEELLEPGTNVLVVSYTNRAIDEICSKLLEEGIDFVRLGTGLSCAADCRDHLFSERVRKSANATDVKNLIHNTRVFVATTTTMTSQQALFTLKQFSLVVIDEASQIPEPCLLPLLCAQQSGKAVLSKVVMIGDHKQLPAVVQQTEEVSEVEEKPLRDIGLTNCRYSLFERFLKFYGDNPEVVYMLKMHGRMHPDIAQFPNDLFYNNMLIPVPRPHQQEVLPTQVEADNRIEALLRTRRVAFLATPYPEDPASDKVNQVEAEMIAVTLLQIYQIERQNFVADRTVGVIVPYRNQIAAIRKEVEKYGIPQLMEIAIDTVERFQGSQRRYILYGFTVHQYHSLKFLTDNIFRDTDGTVVDRKLNVAMTRAEEHLFLFGNKDLLRNVEIFSKLIDFTKDRGEYFEIPSEEFRQIENNFNEKTKINCK